MSHKVLPKAPPPSDFSFDCNICMSLPEEPIATPCGHIYCWECFYIAAPSREKIFCHVCRCEMLFHEVASLKVASYKERTTFLQKAGYNIPPRPISIRELEKNKRIMKGGVKIKSNGDIVLRMVITRNMISFLVFLAFVMCIVAYGVKNFMLGS